MGVFKKILNPLTKGQTLQDRMDEFDRLCKEIKSLEGTVTKKAESLYNHRKEDVRMIQELQGIRVLFCEGNGNLYEADAGGEELLDLWTEVQSELPPTKETLQQLYVPGL